MPQVISGVNTMETRSAYIFTSELGLLQEIIDYCHGHFEEYYNLSWQLFALLLLSFKHNKRV